MKKIIVTAGVLKNNDTYLCTQRAESKLPYISKKFEFPGGKVEEGESLELCLQRELKEELDIEIIVNKLDYLMEVIHRLMELSMKVILLDGP